MRQTEPLIVLAGVVLLITDTVFQTGALAASGAGLISVGCIMMFHQNIVNTTT